MMSSYASLHIVKNKTIAKVPIMLAAGFGLNGNDVKIVIYKK